MRQTITMNPLEAYLEKVRAIVKRDGYAVQGVLLPQPFAYTVGLSAPRPAERISILMADEPDQERSTQQLPEIVVLGLPPTVAEDVLRVVAARLLRGELTLEAGADYDRVFRDLPARFAPVPAASVRSTLKVAAMLHCASEPLAAWQLLWPDGSGRFPGHPQVDVSCAASQNLAMLGGPSALPH